MGSEVAPQSCPHFPGVVAGSFLGLNDSGLGIFGLRVVKFSDCLVSGVLTLIGAKPCKPSPLFSRQGDGLTYRKSSMFRGLFGFIR